MRISAFYRRRNCRCGAVTEEGKRRCRKCLDRAAYYRRKRYPESFNTSLNWEEDL